MLTYQNIKNNNTRSIDARLYNDEYFDFMLYRGEVVGLNCDIDDSLIADFSDMNIEDGILYSSRQWVGAINNGILLEDIGFTGIDNGLIHFEKDKISNYDFLKILTGSTYEINSGETRLFLTPITGNTQNFAYPMFLEEENDKKYISFKGGFYQGFYKLFGFDYQVLPNGPDFEWNLSFTIRPRDYEIGIDTLNHIHPENKGIFFYIGTRAENKFINFYKLDDETKETVTIPSINNDGYLDPSMCNPSAISYNIQNHIVEPQDYTFDIVEEKTKKRGYFPPEYFDEDSTQPCNCHKETPKQKNKEKRIYLKNGCECDIHSIPDYKWHVSDLYTYKYDEGAMNCCKGNKCKPDDNPCKPQPLPKCDCDKSYFMDNYFQDLECNKGKKYMSDEYLVRDIKIDENNITDSLGHLFTKKGYYEITTDNKFLMFDRTPLGLTVKDWVEGTKVTLTGRNDWGNINYFPIMNRTRTGYTVDNIYKYQEENTIPYNVYKDIKNNAFALRITDDGAIGYKYAYLDCNADNEQHYTVKEEYSKPGLIKKDEWNYIVVKFVILNPTIIHRKDGTLCPDPFKGKRKMRIYFYVNNYLIFISKELNEFNFRELNDIYLKQEAVPYSISLGGGTQGLIETILPDYYYQPEFIFPIEKDFCGTFMGDISSFKIYDGHIDCITLKDLKN